MSRSRRSEAVNGAHVERRLVERVRTLPDWDEALGGHGDEGDGPGWPMRSRILIYGDEGVGKSSEALRVASVIGPSLYVSSEQDEPQLARYCRRMRVKTEKLWFLHEAVAGTIASELRADVRAYAMAVIDSVQAMVRKDGSDIPPNELVRAVQKLETAGTRVSSLVFLSQVNDEGRVAGARKLRHTVDTVVHLTETHIEVEKSRFGPKRKVARLNPTTQIGELPPTPPVNADSHTGKRRLRAV